jgi:hypothetical protein
MLARQLPRFSSVVFRRIYILRVITVNHRQKPRTTIAKNMSPSYDFNVVGFAPLQHAARPISTRRALDLAPQRHDLRRPGGRAHQIIGKPMCMDMGTGRSGRNRTEAKLRRLFLPSTFAPGENPKCRAAHPMPCSFAKGTASLRTLGILRMFAYMRVEFDEVFKAMSITGGIDTMLEVENEANRGRSSGRRVAA